MAFTKFFSKDCAFFSLLMQIVPKYFRNNDFIVMQVEALLSLLVFILYFD